MVKPNKRATTKHKSANKVDTPLVHRERDILQKEQIDSSRNKSREASHRRSVVKNQWKQPPSLTNLVVNPQYDPVEQPNNSNNLLTSSPTCMSNVETLWFLFKMPNRLKKAI